jgi:hypothetical protein
MAYNLIFPKAIFTAASMTTSQTSAAYKINLQDNIGIQLDWTGAPVGTFSFEISSDHLQDLNGNITFAGHWITLPVTPAIIAAGTPDDAYVDLNQQSAQFFRVVYNATSGTGTLNGLFVAKAI